jgi:hypothetical protein
MKLHRKQKGFLVQGFLFVTVILASFSLLGSKGGTHKATALEPQNLPTVGAIRWDAWYTGTIMGATDEVALTPSQWHDRLPFYAVISPDGSTVQIRLDEQSQMDTEIAAAKAGGIDYWAFGYYGDTDPNSNALHKYLSSNYKNDVKYSLIIFPMVMDKANWLDTTVSHFSDSQYVKVLGGRPLVYAFDAGGPITPENIVDLRAAAVAQGLPNPYIVWMTWDVGDGQCTAHGCDAISVYAMTPPGEAGTIVPFSDLANKYLWYWNHAKTNSFKVVPSFGTGWDPRPRYAYPPPWGIGGETATTVGTPSEIAQNLQTAADWIAANPSAAESKTILIYAWNEFAEGGWLTPLLQSGTARLDALKIVKDRWLLDTTSPQVSVTAPKNNTTVQKNSNVTITASATDDSEVSKVEFYVNSSLKCTDMTAPYSCAWLVPGARNAPYNLQAKAYDSANNIGSSAIIKVTSK